MSVRREKGSARLKAQMTVGALKGIQAWAELVAQQASLYAPVDTSTLATSIHTDENGPYQLSDTEFYQLIGTWVPYARAQEFGSGLHAEIGPREKIPIIAGFWTGKSDKKALAFNWPDGPKDHPAHQGEGWFLFRSIMHPGVKAQPYLRPALLAKKQDGQRLFLSAMLAEMRKKA